MSKRKIVFSDDEDDDYRPPLLRRRRFSPSDYSPVVSSSQRLLLSPNRDNIQLEELPPVNSLNDLLNIGKSFKCYKNINNLMLWKIVPYIEELDNMIGMQAVKQSLFYQIIYYLQNMHERNVSGDYLHTVITGAAGCGKTSIGKILGNIYQHLGILTKTGKFRIAHREDFIAEYLGQTAAKTKKLLTSCLGGCLFVDEIYALGAGKKDHDSYSKEAIDTINAFLSEHKHDFVFICAGYKDEIDKCFFSMNEGLRRRFQWQHHIDKYTEVELAEILFKMIKENKWEISVELKDVVNVIRNNKNLFKDAGGSCENFLSKMKLTHSKRVFGLSKDQKFKITKDDMENAIKMMKENDTCEKKRNNNMYI